MLDAFMTAQLGAAAVLLAALLPAAVGSLARRNLALAFRLAQAACLGGVVTALAMLAVALAAGPISWSLGTWWPEAGFGGIGFGIRVDVLSAGMLALVSLLGWVVVRYSQRYLDGDAGQARYLRHLLQTLSAVALLVTANNLLVVALAWTATGFALHRLLVFYGARPEAAVAAHQKFLLSRAADVCLLGAVTLLGNAAGTLDFDRLLAPATLASASPQLIEWALLLCACAAVLKCAQLPCHGWLLRVMEAPTPVSALLHAGIVNIGGFVLLRLSPLLEQAMAAQWLLVVAGAATAVIGGLCMQVQPAVKLRLAWSTCAQMGYMLLECGLGLYALAFLHLLGHSLYKAHAFLHAGSTVREYEAARLAGAGPSSTPAAHLGALGAGLALAVVAGLVGHQEVAAASLLTAFLVAPLLGGAQGVHLAQRVGAALVLVVAHGVMAPVFDSSLPTAPAAPLLVAFAGIALLALWAVSLAVVTWPQAPQIKATVRWLRAGLHLDAVFMHLTFVVWPPRPVRTRIGACPVVLAAEGSAS